MITKIVILYDKINNEKLMNSEDNYSLRHSVHE